MTNHFRIRAGVVGAFVSAVALVGSVAVAVPAAHASTGPAPSPASDTSGTGGSAVGATPILQLMSFGDSTGLPLACNLSTSLLAGAAPGTSNLINDFLSQCNALSAEGQTYLDKAITASEALDVLNPVLDPYFAGMSSALKNLGTTYGPQLAPFGPMIAGLGTTVTFFEGS